MENVELWDGNISGYFMWKPSYSFNEFRTAWKLIIFFWPIVFRFHILVTINQPKYTVGGKSPIVYFGGNCVPILIQFTLVCLLFIMTHTTIRMMEVTMITDIPPPANPAVGIERHTISYSIYATTLWALSNQSHRSKIIAWAIIYIMMHANQYPP